MSHIPSDPAMLVSYINTQLRDFYPDLKELCKALDLDQEEICQKLQPIGYRYDPDTNRFR